MMMVQITLLSMVSPYRIVRCKDKNNNVSRSMISIHLDFAASQLRLVGGGIQCRTRKLLGYILAN